MNVDKKSMVRMFPMVVASFFVGTSAGDLNIWGKIFFLSLVLIAAYVAVFLSTRPNRKTERRTK